MSKKNTICTIIIIIASLFFATAVSTLASLDDPDVPDWQTLIRSNIEKERTSARQTVLDNRKETIRYLLSVVNSPIEEGENFFASTTSRNIAISLLGKLRAKEAVADLSQWLSPKPGQGRTTWIPPTLTPAGYALVNIGLPSVPPVLKLLKTDKPKSLYREQYIRIIVCIKGLAETELLFQDALAKETDLSKRQNLKVALDFVKDPRLRKTLERVYKVINRVE